MTEGVKELLTCLELYMIQTTVVVLLTLILLTKENYLTPHVHC